MNNYLLQLLKEIKTIIIPGLGALTLTNEATGEMMFMPYLKYDDGTPAANVAYRLLRQDGAVVEGVTDSRGRIPTQHGLSFEEVTVEILDGEGDRCHD